MGSRRPAEGGEEPPTLPRSQALLLCHELGLSEMPSSRAQSPKPEALRANVKGRGTGSHRWPRLLQRRGPSLSPKPPRFAARRGRGSRSRLNVTVTSGDGKKNSRRPGLPRADGAGSSDFSIGKARVILMSGRGRQGRSPQKGSLRGHPAFRSEIIAPLRFPVSTRQFY